MTYQVEARKDGTYRVYAFSPRLAAKLNKLLKVYPKNVDFEAEKSEGIFPFTEKQKSKVEDILLG